jgi:hypothetical protein
VYEILVVSFACFGYFKYSREYSLASGFFLNFVHINKHGKFAVAKYRPIFKVLYAIYGGPGSSVGIATDYGLDGPGIESKMAGVVRLVHSLLLDVQSYCQIADVFF